MFSNKIVKIMYFFRNVKVFKLSDFWFFYKINLTRSLLFIKYKMCVHNVYIFFFTFFYSFICSYLLCYFIRRISLLFHFVSPKWFSISVTLYIRFSDCYPCFKFFTISHQLYAVVYRFILLTFPGDGFTHYFHKITINYVLYIIASKWKFPHLMVFFFFFFNREYIIYCMPLLCFTLAYIVS